METLEQHGKLLENLTTDVKEVKLDVRNIKGQINAIAGTLNMHTAMHQQHEHRLIAIEENVRELYERAHRVEAKV